MWQVEENQFQLPKDRPSGVKDHHSQIDVLDGGPGWLEVLDGRDAVPTVRGGAFLYLKNEKKNVWCGDHTMNIRTLSILWFLVFLLDVTDLKHAGIPLEDLHID